MFYVVVYGSGLYQAAFEAEMEKQIDSSSSVIREDYRETGSPLPGLKFCQYLFQIRHSRDGASFFHAQTCHRIGKFQEFQSLVLC